MRYFEVAATSAGAGVGDGLGRHTAQDGGGVTAWMDWDGMPMDFLLSHFTLLGVDLQWWMPILGGVTAVYAFWLVRFGPGD